MKFNLISVLNDILNTEYKSWHSFFLSFFLGVSRIFLIHIIFVAYFSTYTGDMAVNMLNHFFNNEKLFKFKWKNK